MRLSPTHITTIRESALNHFGTDAQIWLFGSRVRDEEKCGDLDLFIEVQDKTASDLIACKLKFLHELHKKLGEQKIDVVIQRRNSPIELPIYQIAKLTGVRLQ
jgi:predicted nucleotidyltransferase